MSREHVPLYPCRDCTSFRPGAGDEGRCVVADHVALPPWTVQTRPDWAVQWNDSCDLFESDQKEVKP